MSETMYLRALIAVLHQHLSALRGGERGSVSTEQVIITAVLAALAITTTAIIVAKVTARAKAIPLQ